MSAGDQHSRLHANIPKSNEINLTCNFPRSHREPDTFIGLQRTEDGRQPPQDNQSAQSISFYGSGDSELSCYTLMTCPRTIHYMINRSRAAAQRCAHRAETLCSYTGQLIIIILCPLQPFIFSSSRADCETFGISSWSNRCILRSVVTTGKFWLKWHSMIKAFRLGNSWIV